MSNFDPNAILRGAQLTFVGAHRALQNPDLFTTDHYRQAAVAVCAGLAIRIILNIPIYLVKAFVWIISIFVNLDHETWDDTLIGGLDFISRSVLQIPFFLMMVMSSITPTLDNLFMDSLKWVDTTYVQKHKSDDPSTLRAMYYPTLRMYGTHGEREKKEQRSLLDGVVLFLTKYGRRAAISLAVYLLTFIPGIGRFVLPAASFYTFNKAVGPVPAGIIFASGLIIPKHYMVQFLQTYFSSRSLMSRLLEPYFHRIRFTKQQKRVWFIDRSGVLFGFSAAFAVMVKIPLLGVLIYGIAEASTAYLITKITEPPPPPGPGGVAEKEFIESEVRWKNRHLFLNLPLDRLDEFNARMVGAEKVTKSDVLEVPRQKFT
ncbi:putative transmembrane protein UsgS [Cladophialophora carrionii]|uniref:Putative transmembrane protein UsgS n=1 Tax=Cladophialophora carrionii TaxID=86049 RepID=A0A1C1CGH1_9EURO|nr:putative transmembrane protein UsgS [Cladophialophora carrionii]